MISVGLLDDEGYTCSIWNDTLKFCKETLIVARAKKTNRFYVMHARLCWEEENVAADTVGELWPKSEKGMQKLAVDDLVLELKNMNLDKCVDCLAGKQNITSFQSRPPMRRKAQLVLVHTNVCSSNTNSYAGS